MKQTFTFPEGLLGFAEIEKMQLIPIEVDFDATFYELVTEDDELGFLLVDPFKIQPGYLVDLSEDIIEKLEVEKEEDVVVLSLVTLKDSLSTSTTNLKAPVIFNVKSRKAYQWIDSSSDRSIRHPLVSPVKEDV